MITKKKGLYLGLLLSMFGIGSAVQAYSVTINNSTPHTVKFRLVGVNPCLRSREKREQSLLAGHKTKINTFWCPLRGLEAWVQRSGHPVVKAKPYYARPEGLLGGSLVISGSDEDGYTVFLRRSGKLISSE